MEFDVSAFDKASFQARKKEVPVKDLSSFFKGIKEGETPVWVVRGLTGQELARANEAQEKNKAKNAVAEALTSGNSDELQTAVKEILGLSESVPDELAKRLEMLSLGSVSPVVDHRIAVKLAQNFPIEFYSLTNVIMKLTGEGAVPGKPKRSSKRRESSTP